VALLKLPQQWYHDTSSYCSTQYSHHTNYISAVYGSSDYFQAHYNEVAHIFCTQLSTMGTKRGSVAIEVRGHYYCYHRYYLLEPCWVGDNLIKIWLVLGLFKKFDVHSAGASSLNSLCDAGYFRWQRGSWWRSSTLDHSPYWLALVPDGLNRSVPGKLLHFSSQPTNSGQWEVQVSEDTDRTQRVSFSKWCHWISCPRQCWSI
jgi:hypothetical protein